MEEGKEGIRRSEKLELIRRRGRKVKWIGKKMGKGRMD